MVYLVVERESSQPTHRHRVIVAAGGPAQQKDVIAESERKMLGSLANRRITYAELHSIIYIGGRYQVLMSIDQIGRFARLVDTVIYSQA